jgi:hypothetical protein
VDGFDDKRGTIAILNIGGMHLGTDQQTASIGHEAWRNIYATSGIELADWE